MRSINKMFLQWLANFKVALSLTNNLSQDVFNAVYLPTFAPSNFSLDRCV